MCRSERAITALALGVVTLAGCRGGVSDRPPVHLVANMDHQQKYEAQEANSFNADNRAMRVPVAGTVATGRLRDDDHLHRARGLDGKIVDAPPPSLDVDAKWLARGHARYDIFCAPCHDTTGTGKGIVVDRGMLEPPSLLDPRLRQQTLGRFYEVMTEGLRNMPSHGAQVPVEDRWAIAAHIRVLQIGRNAGLEQAPPDDASETGWR